MISLAAITPEEEAAEDKEPVEVEPRVTIILQNAEIEDVLFLFHANVHVLATLNTNYFSFNI